MFDICNNNTQIEIWERHWAKIDAGLKVCLLFLFARSFEPLLRFLCLLGLCVSLRSRLGDAELYRDIRVKEQKEVFCRLTFVDAQIESVVVAVAVGDNE